MRSTSCSRVHACGGLDDGIAMGEEVLVVGPQGAMGSKLKASDSVANCIKISPPSGVPSKVCTPADLSHIILFNPHPSGHQPPGSCKHQ
jgi:hypothetical protein